MSNCAACGTVLAYVCAGSDAISSLFSPLACCPNDACRDYRHVIFIGHLETEEERKLRSKATDFLHKLTGGKI